MARQFSELARVELELKPWAEAKGWNVSWVQTQGGQWLVQLAPKPTTSSAR